MPCLSDWFYLAVFSSVIASIVTTLQKSALSEKTTNPVAFAIYFQFLVFLFGLPAAILNTNHFSFSVTTFLMLMTMAFFTCVGNLIYYFALSSIEVSEAAIVSSTASLWLLIGSSIFLNEKITSSKIAGIALVLFGIFFIFFDRHSFKKFGFFHILVLISAAFSSITGMFDKVLLNSFEISTYQVLSYFLQALFAALMIPSSLKKLKSLAAFNQTNIIIIFAAILLNLGAFCYFSAIKHGGEISKINPILQASTILTILFGVIFFKENDNIFKKLSGAIIVFAGILLIK